MRRLWMMGVLAGLATGFAVAQQAAPLASSPQTGDHPRAEKVYKAGHGASFPELLPVPDRKAAEETCSGKRKGAADFSFVVDTDGVPRDIVFDRPIGNELDRLALFLLAEDRFKPGLHKGVPVAVAESAEISLQACTDHRVDEAGKMQTFLRLQTAPTQKFMHLAGLPADIAYGLGGSGGIVLPSAKNHNVPGAAKVGDADVTPPVIENVKGAEFSEQARKERISGICVLSFVVDAQGLPQNIRVTRPLGYGLDQKAVEAVRQDRFKPAMKNGVPVPVMQSMEISFNIY